MKANTFSWYKDRLFAMSFNELVWRIMLLIKKKFWARKNPNYTPNLIISKLKPLNDLKYSTGKEEVSEIIIEANSYLNHEWFFFGLKNCSEELIDWHKDPVSTISAPRKFGFHINHRDELIVGNIKNTWEKNRHHHLTILAQAFYLTKEEKYAVEVKKQLESWINDNPYLIGVNWTHPLEQGIRLISWVYIYKFLQVSQYFESIFGAQGFIWKSVFEHQKFIEQTYSRGSSANNHLIGEMAGLFIASEIWPIFDKSKKWSTLSKKILEKELLVQNFSDGVNKELGFSYQHFVAQFSLLCLEEDDSFSKPFKDMLKSMIKFSHQISEVLGTVPNYGDGDEGMALQINPIASGQLAWLYAYSDKLLNTQFGQKLNQSLNLLEDSSQFEEDKSSSFISREAGIFVVSKYINRHKVGVLFDFGPLGMGSMAAHGHADALSVSLNIDAMEILVDPGTYCYHDDLKWREYFRSAKAHNTLSINDQDQSEQLGPFLWGKKAKCTLVEENIEEGKCTALHDGYDNLGVIHRRTIKVNSGLEITDSIEGKGEINVESRFHFHPEVMVTLEGGKCSIVRGNISLVFESQNNFEIFLIKGTEEGGWYSPKFGVKIPTTTLVLKGEVSLPHTLSYQIRV